MLEYSEMMLSITITTNIADPDEAIRWTTAQIAAALGTMGDECREGRHNEDGDAALAGGERACCVR